MVNRLWSYRSWDIESRNIKNCWVSKKIPKPQVWHLTNSSSESNNPHNFLKELKKIFVQTLTDFLLQQQKYKRWAIFDILMTITLGVIMITRQMTPFFSYTFWALFVAIFLFSISRLFFYRKVSNFWYITCFVRIFIPIWLRSFRL